jgi:Na+/pantothenate symporter
MFGALASCVIGVGIMALLEKYSYFKYWWVSLIPAILFGIAECVCFAISVLPV